MLENIVNVLADLCLGDQAASYRLKGSPDGNTWATAPDTGEYSGRAKFYAALQAITESTAYQALQGKFEIVVPNTNGAMARNDFAQLLALNDLAPFALKPTDTTALAALKSANEALAQAWEADAKLTDAQRAGGVAHFSNEWLTDRGNFLERKNWYNNKNVLPFNPSLDTNRQEAPGALYNPYELENSFYQDIASDYKIAQGLINDATRHYLFGDEQGNTLSGMGLDDHLYGGAGDDTLTGGQGADYLEGGTGNDSYVYTSGHGADTLLDHDGSIQIAGQASTLDGSQSKSSLNTLKQSTWKDANGVSYTLLDGDLIAGGTLRISGSPLGGGKNSIDIKNFKNGELGITLDATARIAIKTGTGQNSFLDPTYQVSNNTTALAEGLGETVTVFLSTAAQAGETLALNIAGGQPSDWSAVFGDSEQAFGNSPLTVALSEGQTQVTFALVNTGDIDTSGAWQLTAALTDADGQEAASNQMQIDFTATVEPDGQSTTLTIPGDIQPEDTNLAKDGIQAARDSVGNPIGTAGPYADMLLGSGGNDHLVLGELDDDSAAGSGDDWMEGGSGDDYMRGDIGNDLLEGGTGRDLLIGEDGNDRLYAHANTEIATAIASGDTDSGSGNQGEWLSGNAGDDTLIAGADNDVLAGGAGTDLLIAGAGDDHILGDADYTVQFIQEADPRYTLDGTDWYHSSSDTFNWTITRGPDTTLFAPVYGETNPAGGNDVIYAGAGDDHVWAGIGDDLITGDGGADKAVVRAESRRWRDGGRGDIYSAANDAAFKIRKE